MVCGSYSVDKLSRPNSMHYLFPIILVFLGVQVKAQADQDRLTATLKDFHQALVAQNTISINQQTDRALSYGHSNGWVENKKEFLQNIQTGYMRYLGYREDSLKVELNGSIAHARFIADIEASLNGNMNTFHLKVLEVWVKKGKRWILFARQAVRVV